jgi:hypothetical protein
MENTIKNWAISDIQSLTETEAKTLATDTETIKDHTIYFVDFGGYFGFSRLVFKNNHHIYYANDYELHHNYKPHSKDELKALYIQGANNILFTEEEIAEPITDYEEYNRKSYFLHNYYGMQTDYISIFGNPKEHPNFEEEIKGMTYNPVALAYMSDANFVQHHIELCDTLNNEREKMSESYEYLKSTFLYEMYNHEYGINWQADYDTLSAFYNVKYHDCDLEAYFKELNFTDLQRKAYLDARTQYFKEANND